MSNTSKNLKKRMKAPRELVSAAKRGERVTLKHRTDTRATHVRRFSKAFAAYACMAALLIGGAAIVPSMIGEAGTPASQPKGDIGVQSLSVPDEPVKPAAAEDYVSLSAEQAERYIRPDLIWANELNPELKDSVIWSAEIADGETAVTHALTLPDVGDENAEYALEFRIEKIDDEEMNPTLSYIVRRMQPIEGGLLEGGFEKVNIKPIEGEEYTSSYFSADRGALSALDTEALLSELNGAGDNLRFVLRIAWQSLDGNRIPDQEGWNHCSMDLSLIANHWFKFIDQEGYYRNDLIWASEEYINHIFYATRYDDEDTYSILENSENVSGYTVAVDFQLCFVYDDPEKTNYVDVTGNDEAEMVEKALGWKPIVAGESYEAPCEQLMALNDADILPAFAEAYEEMYGVDADSISHIAVLISCACQSAE